MLLGGRPSLRFMKLEKRSPAIAAPATNAPTFHGNPSCSAASGSQQRKGNSANGFCRTERRASVGQDGSPVEWSVEARAERPFGEQGGAVGDDDQQDELGD